MKPIAAPGVGAGVTMLELFFDLVFVFFITQLTGLITEAAGWRGYLEAALVLCVTWWMYDGYAWLANNVAPTTTATRLPMLMAMTCFLAMAIVVPDVFGAGAPLFAAAYTLVVTIHAIQFSRSSVGGSGRAIRQVLPFNYGVCGLLVLAAVIGPAWGWLAWVGAVLLLVGSLARRQESGISLRTEHFAERHRLLIIIALGETIIAVGAGAEGSLTQPTVLGVMLLAMILISALWWIYYAVGDDRLGLHALEEVDGPRQATVAIRAYSFAHLLHIGGLVLIAAGLHDVVHDPAHHLSPALAVTLAAGGACFLVGQVVFRAQLGLGSAGPHLAAAALLLATVPLGVLVGGGAQLVAIAVIAAGLATVLQREAAGSDEAAAV